MKTKSIFLIIFSLIVSACATTGNKGSEKEFEEGDKITLPTSESQGLIRSPFLNTQKSTIFNQNGISIDFYYGIGGRYLIKMNIPKHLTLNFSKAEGTLLVDYQGNSPGSSPETLSLSSSAEGLFQGQGNIRNGKTDFRLELLAPAPGGGLFKKELEFSVVITDDFSLSE